MRIFSICATLVASLGMGSLALANGPEAYGGPMMAGGDPCACDPCDPCAGGHHGHRHRRNAEAGFNCGCNGSYKYPVPPLYTYHWPGMYSAQLMTDYHSPWRFPPLKPYTDEVPIEVQSSLKSLRRVQQASATVVETRTSTGPSFSDQVERSLR
jgi:hypothetical protein